MTFTTTPPTKPGFYAWQWKDEDVIYLRDVYKIGDDSLSVDFPESLRFNVNVEQLGGQWCRLVPAEEIEKAYMEGADVPHHSMTKERFQISRAKKVMEGEI